MVNKMSVLHCLRQQKSNGSYWVIAFTEIIDLFVDYLKYAILIDKVCC